MTDLAKRVRICGVIGNARAVKLLEESCRLALRVEQLPGESGPTAAATPMGDLFLQSSGTTGLPKIVRRSGRSLDAVARAMAEVIGFTPADRVLMALPLPHSYGLEHGLLAPLWAGSCVHLCAGLDFPVVVRELKDEGITIFPGVPSAFEMLSHVAGANVAMPSLRLAYSAGGPLPREVFDAFATRFGIAVTQLYGASEIGSVTYNSPAGGVPAGDFDPASVGRPMAGVEIRILGGQPDGEIAIRAASMFDGYVDSPAELVDGFFATGDLGHVDAAGRLFITGRLKLLIDVGGFKVNPMEVEAVIARHPTVGSCIVVAMRQSRTVNRLKAVVTPRYPELQVPLEELRQWARRHLAAYKVPRLFELRASLPRTPSGKIMRQLLESTASST